MGSFKYFQNTVPYFLYGMYFALFRTESKGRSTISKISLIKSKDLTIQERSGLSLLFDNLDCIFKISVLPLQAFAYE